MKSQHFRLTAYSALAASLLVNSESDAQVVIKNFEPDLRMMNWVDDTLMDDTISIDIDDNGIYDLIFEFQISDCGHCNADLHVQFTDAVIGILNTSGPSFHDYDFSSGDMISGLPEESETEITLGSYARYPGSYGGYISTDWKFFTINDYMGLYLQLGGEIHYGWVRLSMRTLEDADHSYWRYTGSPLTIYEVGYHTIPEAPLLCNAGTLPEEKSIYQVRLSDVTDANDITDLAFTFYAGDSMDFSELRFYLVPSREDMLNFSVEDALALDPSRYYSLSPDLIVPDVYNSFSLPEGLLDISGNAFSSDMYYSGFYLKIPEADTIGLSLSAPFLVKRTELQYCSLETTDPTMIYSIDEAAFVVSFTAEGESPDIEEYGAGVVLDKDAENWYYYGIDSYDFVDTIVGIIRFPNTGPGEYEVPLTGLTHDIFGDPLFALEEYHPIIVGIPDGYYRDLLCLDWDFSGANYLSTEINSVNGEILIQQLSGNELLISIENISEGNFQFELRSISSQLFTNEKILTSPQTISIQDVAAGIYIATIKKDGIAVATEKIIIASH